MEEKHIGLEFKKIVRAIKSYIFKTCNNNLTANQNYILGMVAYSEKKNEEIFQKDIEKKLRISRSTATEILQIMERENLIKRIPVSYDKRLKKIILGEKGIEVDKNIENHFKKIENKMINGISKEDLELFYVVMNKMESNLKDEEEK